MDEWIDRVEGVLALHPGVTDRSELDFIRLSRDLVCWWQKGLHYEKPNGDFAYDGNLELVLERLANGTYSVRWGRPPAAQEGASLEETVNSFALSLVDLEN
jgi:hypothetical protein